MMQVSSGRLRQPAHNDESDSSRAEELIYSTYYSAGLQYTSGSGSLARGNRGVEAQTDGGLVKWHDIISHYYIV